MRLVKVAKALGMTGQQLRKELADVNFGVKPTDREVPDNLAQGIIRYVANKNGIEVDMENLGLDLDDDTTDDLSDGAESETVEQEEQHDEKPKESLNVLRKLSLDDVSQEAIEKQQQQMAAKPVGPKPHVSRGSKKAVQHKKKPEQVVQEQIKKKEGTVMLPAHITVKEFAEKTGIQIPQIIQVLMKNGVMATITQTIDFDTAAIVASDLGVDVQKEIEAAKAEDLYAGNLEELIKDEPENLTERPPIVVVMGHVDHGKTSILDAVRQTDVVSGEAGGITQHIGAYQVFHGDEKSPITFLDTPGHEAFTAMRARGAQVTDVAIIVVAADEGIKPTTVEAINHAKDAGVPIIVALNKMDREGADPDRVKGELASHGLQPEDWGGHVPVIPCSAKTKMGINDLLDAVVLISQMAELKANANRAAIATVIESHLDPSLGALATVVINTGTLKQGNVIVCGQTSGKVRTMMDAHGVRLQQVGPSGAVRISGFSEVPQVGDILQVVSSEQEARTLLDAMREHGELHKKRSFVDLVARLSEGKLTQLKVVLKADTQGSLDALRDALAKLSGTEVGVKVIHGAIGAVSETDVMMASASDGIVIAFHVLVPPAVERTAEREGVKVRKYEVVYSLLDDIEALLKGLVEPEEEEKILGHVEIRGVFLNKKTEQIVGGRVITGVVKRLPFRILREEQEVGTGRITSLKSVDKDVKEVKEGHDCGMRVETSLPIQENDVLEVYLREFKKKD